MRLLEITYQDKPSRYFVDGKRVSRDKWETIHIIGRMNNKTLDCFHGKSKDTGNGNIKHYHYSSLRG